MKPDCYRRPASWALLQIVFACATVVAACQPCVAQGGGSALERNPATPSFTEGDAARVLSDLRQAVETDNPGRFLKSFDAKKMPAFAAFRDQIAQFFETYSPVRMNYHISQASTDADFGAAVAEIMLDGLARQGAASNIRKTVSARVVFGWDGKAWKIVDWAPRETFR